MAESKKQKSTENVTIITDEMLAKLKNTPNVQVAPDKPKISYVVKSFNTQGYYLHFKMVQIYDPITRVASEPEPVIAMGKGQEAYLKFPVSTQFCKEMGENLQKIADAMHGLEYVPPTKETDAAEHDDMVLDFIKRNAKPAFGDLKGSTA